MGTLRRSCGKLWVENNPKLSHRILQRILVAPWEAYKKVLDIAVPAIIEAVFIGVTGIVDTMMVSQLGLDTIAAIGLTHQPKLVTLIPTRALSVGTTAIIARRFGEGNTEKANQCMRNCLVIGVMIAFLSSLFGVVFAKPILVGMGGKGDVLKQGIVYFRITTFGQFFYCVSFVINAAQRGVGKTKIALKTNAVANLSNVFFNYLLINGNFGFPALGIAGAAIATAVGYLLSTILAMSSVLDERGILRIRRNQNWRIELGFLQVLWKISGNTLWEQILTRMGFLITTMMVVKLGDKSLAAHQLAMNYLTLTFTVAEGISASVSALVGQSLGAGKPYLARRNLKICRRISFCTLVVMSLILRCFRYELIAVYTPDQQFAEIAAPLFVIMSMHIFFQSLSNICAGALRGAGDTRYVAIVWMTCVAIVRPSMSYLLGIVCALGLPGIWFGMMTDQICRYIFSNIRLCGDKWTKIHI